MSGMLSRIVVAATILGLAVVTVPVAGSPVDEAGAHCVIFDPDLGCINPACTAAAVYGTARRSNPVTERFLPEAYCTA